MWRQAVDHGEKREYPRDLTKGVDVLAPNREAEKRLGIRGL
jgi:hypothetical protein